MAPPAICKYTSAHCYIREGEFVGSILEFEFREEAHTDYGTDMLTRIMARIYGLRVYHSASEWRSRNY
ncbi:MAG: hypothetical protein F6K54_14370 [Okeania sp. SIO3B5]|uniref:hypothetical protein n=1 Tax=Okeania sp. SIO3B5 TaxID=2607811 RepID=UPI0013FFCC84|nr:hypothetical protein [Okeania sp. SIO3B5]NEO54159.1 hypothetical protein [Okeania sp. SIO3B5]